jgi:hypothetical protein
VFRRQIQSSINEGRLMLYEMQVDKQPFPINTMELQQPKVLIRLHQAEATKGKNVVVGEAKLDLRGKELTREVAYEKTPDGRETFKITVKASGHGKDRPRHLVSKQPSMSWTGRLDREYRAVRPPLHMVAQRCLFQSGERLGTGSSMWQRIRGVFQSQRSRLICYLTSIPNQRPLVVKKG